MEFIPLILFSVVLLAILGEWLYKKFFAPHYEARVKVLKKEFQTGISPHLRNKTGSAQIRNYYWGEFQVDKSDEVLKLGMNLDLYTEIKEGQYGMLTYRKGYALSFRRFRSKK